MPVRQFGNETLGDGRRKKTQVKKLSVLGRQLQFEGLRLLLLGLYDHLRCKERAVTVGVAAGEDGTTVSVVVRGRAAAVQFAANSGTPMRLNKEEMRFRERTIQNSLGLGHQ